MNNKIKVIILILSFTYLHALSIEEIEKEERDIHRLSTIVNDYYGVIKSHRIVGIDDILKKYSSNPKAKLIQEWFFIVSQYSQDVNLVHFMNSSKNTVGLYLQKLNVDIKNSISSEDYRIVRKKLKELGKHNSQEFHFLKEDYSVTKNIYIRTLPIISSLTKIREQQLFKILKKKTKIELLYKILYKNRNNHLSEWGYVQLESGRRGWVNLKNTRRI